MTVELPTPTESAQSVARKRKVSSSKFSVPAIEQELKWRRWFPQEPIDWSANRLPDDVVDRQHKACMAFLEDNMWIRVPGKGRIPLKLRPAQREVLREWITSRRTVNLKARQIGFSTLAAGFTLWMAFGWGDRNIIMLSKGEREAVSLLLKAKQAYKHFPDWVKMRGPRLMDRVRTTMTFENDSMIQSLPSGSDPARGESAFLVVVDEWAFLPNPDEAWASIEPISDIGGRIIGISTANGEGNFFHGLWLGAEADENGFVGIFYPWWAVEERDEQWYEEKKRLLAAWQLAQEYPSTPEEAFVGSGNPFFNLMNLARFTPEEPIWTGTIARDGKKAILSEGSGPLTIWETPNDKARYSYVIGTDIAEGHVHGDYTVAYVLCVQTNKIVAMYRDHEDPDVYGETILPALGWYYRFAVICPEYNNHGMTTTKALQRVKYHRIYRRRTLNKRTDRPLEQLGWYTSTANKGFMCDQLATWLRETPNIPHKYTISELRTFTKDDKGRLSGSPHDDCVMALAITVQCRKYAIEEKIEGGESAEKVRGSFAWWEKQLDNGRREKRGMRPSLV